MSGFSLFVSFSPPRNLGGAYHFNPPTKLEYFYNKIHYLMARAL